MDAIIFCIAKGSDEGKSRDGFAMVVSFSSIKIMDGK